MDARQFRQFRQGHSVLVAELPDCLPKNDLLAFVFRDHPTILDYYPWAEQFGENHNDLCSGRRLTSGCQRSLARRISCAILRLLRRTNIKFSCRAFIRLLGGTIFRLRRALLRFSCCRHAVEPLHPHLPPLFYTSLQWLIPPTCTPFLPAVHALRHHHPGFW